MFKLRLDIPKGVSEVILPNDEHVVLFAATVAPATESVCPAAPLFVTSNRDDSAYTTMAGNSRPESPSLLEGARIIDYSGFVNESERPEKICDGNENTKWCDTNRAPNFITFDLGNERTVSRWHLLSAGSEMAAYITRTCILQGRSSEQEEWRTLDMLVAPTQAVGMDATRIYEFDLW